MMAPSSGRRVFYLVSAEAWEFCKLEFKREFGSSALFTRVCHLERLSPGTFHSGLCSLKQHIMWLQYRGDLDHIWKLPGSFAEES